MRKQNLIAAGCVGLLASTAAWAFPWDIDMVDAVFLRAFEWEMWGTPEGSVSINRYREGCDPTCADPSEVLPEWNRDAIGGNILTNPLASSEEVLADGERLFSIYCQTCHGVDGAGGAPVTDSEKGARYPAVPLISGATAATGYRKDGWIFLTIRNGGINMPSYSYAMDDEEMWSVVTYLRTLPNAELKVQ
jgi:mono/diheme cytochrome c family protein